MSKNIIIFSDGTGQEGGKKYNTNVYKLFNMIEDRTPNQISFYDRGLGTGWRKVTGNISGMGIKKNICDCYEFIFDNYEAGDQIYLFGFSRGATTVRSLSGFIHLFGILPKSRPELIKRAYSIYKINNDEKRKQKAEEFISINHTMWTKIKFIGVWDTVAALGLPIKFLDILIDQIPFFHHTYHNLNLSESVEHARHALAIDDERLTFHPKIWNKEIKEYQTMKQVWFLGMHTDVGGGYKEQQLSDIPLIWIVNEAVEKNLRIYKNQKVEINPDTEGFMHNSRGGFFTQLYRRKIREWDYNKCGNLIVHYSVIMRKKNVNNLDYPAYNSWILDKKYEIEPWPENLRNNSGIMFKPQQQ